VAERGGEFGYKDILEQDPWQLRFEHENENFELDAHREVAKEVVQP